MSIDTIAAYCGENIDAMSENRAKNGDYTRPSANVTRSATALKR